MMKNNQEKNEIQTSNQNGLSGWVSKHQKQCQVNFNKVGMPSKSSEYWKFTSPALWQNDSGSDTHAPAFSVSDNSYDKKRTGFYINFVDGKLDLESLVQLNKRLLGCKISGFEVSRDQENHWASEYLGKAELKAMAPYDRPFALLNGSAVSQGLFLKCEESPKKPIHIFYYGERPVNANIRHLIKIESGSELQLVEHFSGQGKYNIVMEGYFDSDAKFHHNRLVNRSLRNSLIGHFFAECMTASSVKTVNICLGNIAVRNEIFLSLEGSMCNATVAGLGIGKSKKSICDNTIFVSHLDQSSKSRQIIKNVLSQGAKAIFQGKIYVDPKAQKTDGYQMSNGLLLDEESDFLVKPELEIYADDVACSHGSISGSINDEHLFYLKSRGISEQESRRILVEAYLEEVVNEIEDSDLAQFVMEEIREVLV